MRSAHASSLFCPDCHGSPRQIFPTAFGWHCRDHPDAGILFVRTVMEEPVQPPHWLVRFVFYLSFAVLVWLGVFGVILLIHRLTVR